MFFYKLYYTLRRLVRMVIPSDQLKPIYIFVNKYITHIVVITLVVTISFANIFSTETKAQGFNEKSILFALATGSNLEEEYIEETIESDQPQITSYLETPTTAVSATQQILTNEEATDVATKTDLSGDSSSLVKPEISSIEASKQSRDKISEYVVADGDTVGIIAQKFGISTDTILWENNLSKFSYIKPGQKLSILPTTGVSHKVASGDSLNSIAKKYDADVEKIISYNKLIDKEDIQVGQILVIPDGQPYFAPVVPKTQLASVTTIFNPTHVNVPSGETMAWPTTARRISQYYNWRHTGLDIDGEFGDPIWAADDGVITKVAYLNYSYGYHVIIDHGNGKVTLYAHFQKIYVKAGQRVARGDVLGEMGSTGYSTGSHLHLEVRINGKKYNPLSYIR